MSKKLFRLDIHSGGCFYFEQSETPDAYVAPDGTVYANVGNMELEFENDVTIYVIHNKMPHMIIDTEVWRMKEYGGEV